MKMSRKLTGGLVSLGLLLGLTVAGSGGCAAHPERATMGWDHRNDNIPEGSQVDWQAQNFTRDPQGYGTFVAYPPAGSVVQEYNLPRTHNPVPVTRNHVHGPTNPIGFAQTYRPVGEPQPY